MQDPRRAPTGGRQALFWAALVVGTLLVLEGLIGLYRRWYDDHAGGCGFPAGFFVAKDDTGFGMRPGFHGTFTRGEFSRIPLNTNGDGYREVPFEELGDGPRVALVGDSIVFGAGVGEEDAMDARLERILSADRGPVAVLNLGVYAYSFEEYLAVLQHDVPSLHPRVAVIGFCINDIENGEDAWPIALARGGTHLALKRLSNLVWLAAQVRIRWLDPDSPANFRATAEQWRALCNRTVDQWLEPTAEERLGHNLDRLVALGSAPGAPQVVVAIWPILYELREPDERWKVPRRILRAALEERGIPYVDLFDGFAAAGDPESLYLPDDPMHFNPKGHRLAARLLAPAVEKRLP